jgi:hypothetical protein
MPRAVRRERNRELFRQVNETIAGLDRLATKTETLGLICECHTLGCANLVQVPAILFAAVKDDGSLFLVSQGHIDPEQDVIVADHGSFQVVRDR